MPNPLDQLIPLLIDLQRWIYRAISGELGAFAASRDWWALAAVLPLGVVFGAAHALTPGHGKTVLASYVLGSRLRPLRSTLVAAVLAATHIGSAVLIALVASWLIERTFVGAGRAPALELVSRGLLIVIGSWLVLRAVWGRAHAHGEGLAVGFVAGLVPCPLTLFAMFYALGRGVPEAGLVFALAMMLGVLSTLAVVALASAFAREALVALTARHGSSAERILRWLDGLSGLLLVVIGIRALLR